MEKKQQKEIVVVIVGVIILAVILANNLGKVKFKSTAAIDAAAKKAFQKAAPGKERPRQVLDEKNMPWGRDPFTMKEIGAGPAVGENVMDLSLMGITAGVGIRPSAIINNEIVKEGSKVGKFTVLKIKENRVTVTDGEEKIELLLDR